MMLTIHGLPLHIKYQDLKSLIKEKCNISDYILDNLGSDGDGTKKVRIGLADEREGSYLIKCLDGFRLSGNMLRVVPVRKPPLSNPQQNYDQGGGYPQRNDYPNQSGPNYSQPARPMDPMSRPDMIRPDVPRQDSWGAGNNQWGSNQHPSGPNQMAQAPVQQNNYNYQQPHGMNVPYGQQHAQGYRADIRPQYDQRDQYAGRVAPQAQGYGFPKNDVPDLGDKRAHVLRSVEIVDEPMSRPIAQPQQFPGPGYDPPQQKPITIMKGNFQGPQYNLDRQAAYPGPGGPVHPHHGQGHAGPHHAPTLQMPAGPGTSSSWTRPIPPEKQPYAKPSPTGFDRKYPEADKRSMMGKPLSDPSRNVHDPYNKDFGAKPGPRFSPRRDEPDSHGRRMPSPGRRMPSPGRRMPSPGRRMPSPGRRMPSPGRRMPSPDRRMPSPGRRMPSPGRRMPSPGRRMPSPGRRMPSPGRRLSPGKRMSPGRRLSPPGRRLLSPGRRLSPSGKRMSPGDAPARRADSPPHKRHDSPGRYSPSRRHMDKPVEKYGSSESNRFKDVRPAYDPPTQAPKQAMYSGGYRPTLHENVQYPVPGARQPESRAAAWQERDKPMFPAGAKKDERRKPTFEPRIDPAELKRSRSPRQSRSPIRRDRSPLRDRYKKHSPSPRSPRRSWALEKRRSPEIREAPPPPMWPGQSRDEEQFRRFPDRAEEEKKRVPIWEGRRPEDERRFDNPVRVRTDLGGRPHMEPSPHGDYKPDDRFSSRDPKFEPRETKFESREPKFESRGPKFEPREELRRADDVPKRFERDFREPQRSIDDARPMGNRLDRRGEYSREDFASREEERKIPKIPEVIRDFDDVYKRAQELNKRTEELIRRSDRGRRDEFEGRNERGPDFDRKFDRREERSRDDRPGFRAEERREPEWKTEDRRSVLSPTLKAKRDKAIDEIASKIVDKHGEQFTGDMRSRILDETRLIVGKILQEMFGYNDVSFIEMVVKFNAKYDQKAEARMYNDVLTSLPSHFRNMQANKRAANEPINHEVPAKSARRTHDADLSRDFKSNAAIETYIPEWKPNVVPPRMVENMPPPMIHIPNPMLMPQFDLAQQVGMISQPLMVPAPTYGEEQPESMPSNNFQVQENNNREDSQDGLNLYLCKDDFEPFSEIQAEYLKRFLVSQLIRVSQTGQGWSPDFTLKGLQSLHRYEIETRDTATKQWLQNMDFSEFQLFNVLVYSKEELWYERAAVWLPGHSKCRNIEPLTKLKLQNRKLNGVNIGKWKLVKKIVTVKGTRIYVDMPPSSARALEKCNMLLSYELQKVSVFLKAVAVDKEAFDAGLREPSIKDPAEIIAATQNSPMPSLGHDPNIVKICLKGNKALSVQQARKVKDMIIYHIFKHHQEHANSSKTDFVKFGFCVPGYFGLIPDNPETKRWLLSLDIGKLNRHAVVVLGADDASTKYIKMTVVLKRESSNNMALIFERLKQSNQGVKGLNFTLWKPLTLHPLRDRTSVKTDFDIEMDLESVETIMNKLKYKLDYVDDRHNQHTVSVEYEKSNKRLEELVHKLKSEMNDSYDVANMDIASSEEEDDVVYVGDL